MNFLFVSLLNLIFFLVNFFCMICFFLKRDIYSIIFMLKVVNDEVF